MIVNWTLDCIKGIPVADEGRNVILAPGFNEVSNADWKLVRPLVLDQIENNIIKEEWVRVKGIDAKDAPLVCTLDMVVVDSVAATAEAYVPAILKDITRARVPKIIAETYDKRTLKRWYEDDTREDVLKRITIQLEVIDNPSLASKE
jgi:hypothetical protein